MEVHHHPNVEKKSFKEYFLEFIMIFLAVSLGFAAESLREYINENNRAKEFAKEMVSDLKSDTADLKWYLGYTGYAESNIDTLMQLLSNYEPKEIPTGKLYWYGLFGGTPGQFVPHDATIHQMESSGSLRYFTNVDLNKKVAEYDQLCRAWEKNEETDRGIYLEVRKARAKIFEFKYNDAANNIYQKYKSTPNKEILDSFFKTNPPVLTYDKASFNEYLEMVRSRFLNRQLSSADTLLNRATILIETLKKVYHLKNE